MAHGNIIDILLAVDKSLPIFGSDKLVKGEIEAQVLSDCEEIVQLLKKDLTVGWYILFKTTKTFSKNKHTNS